MDSLLVNKISKYAKLFADNKFIESGYIAVRKDDGIAITVTKANLNNIGENDVVFVNDKNIESYEGNFRAAAVILFCAIRQDGAATAAAIVDSDNILQYSSKRKPIQPVLDGVAKLLGVTVKSASKNVAAEIVTSLSGYRNACFMPDAGAVVKARGLDELVAAVTVLDKTCGAEMMAEDKGGTQHLNPFNALIEQYAYKLKTSKQIASENKDNNEQTAEDASFNTENAEQNVQNMPSEQADEILKCVTLEDGKVAALACPRYVSVVAAIGKPVAVTGEFKDAYGEEIPCLPYKMILSDKAFKKFAEALNVDTCLFAQHGVIVKAENKEAAYSAINKVENACKKYLGIEE